MFQSYLIIGSPVAAREKTEELLKKAKIQNRQNSPDFYLITAEKSSISIDKVRELKNHIFQKPLTEPYKVVVFQQSNLLTVQAQNALLKILEEPPAHALIILEASHKSSLLPTILSRVTTIWTAAIGDIEKISALENPTAYLENQILINYRKLKEETLQNANSLKTQKYLRSINAIFQAKLLIDANVNPKFVLANLVFGLK